MGPRGRRRRRKRTRRRARRRRRRAPGRRPRQPSLLLLPPPGIPPSPLDWPPLPRGGGHRRPSLSAGSPASASPPFPPFLVLAGGLQCLCHDPGVKKPDSTRGERPWPPTPPRPSCLTAKTMRSLPRGLLLLPFLLWLCLGEIRAAPLCSNNCSFIDNTEISISTTEIHIKLPVDFNISSVTFANGTEVNTSISNGSISALDPGTEYIIYFMNSTETCCKFITTKPSPVSAFHVENITATNVSLTWKYDGLNVYKYLVQIEGNGTNWNASFDTTSATISDLEPATLYTFSIFPVAADRHTLGEPRNTTAFTKPSPVSDLQTGTITNSTIALEWKNSDSNAFSYTYRIQIEGDTPPRNEFSNATSKVLENLNPGTSYTFRIYPVATYNQTEGDAEHITVFTKPSPVSMLRVENISNTTVTLKWDRSDSDASNYTYRIKIEGNDTIRLEFSNNTNIEVWNLEPGTQYTFKVFAVAADNATEGDSEDIIVYTRPNPVFDIRIEDISTTTVSLTWKNDDLRVFNYTYRINISGKSAPRNEFSNNTSAVIWNLEPGIQYTFSICPVAADNHTVGEPENITAYTQPTPVYDISAENLTTDTVTLQWKNRDPANSSYTYWITIEGNGTSKNENSSTERFVINSLEPGTLYKFIIYSVAADNSTHGDPNDTAIYTRPHPVSYIFIESFSNTTVNLTWKNHDLQAPSYTYRIQIEGNDTSRKVLSNTTSEEISNLEPGTSYTFNIFTVAADHKTEGDLNTTTLYTRPSPVSNIHTEIINTTTVKLTWENGDQRASSYIYQIKIQGNNSVDNAYFDKTSSVINNLEPGTSYNFSIYPLAADNKTEGSANTATVYTKPSSVNSISVTDISTTVVNVTWKNPDRASPRYSYRIHTSGGDVENMTSPTTHIEISKLSPGTSYTFSIYSVAGNKTEGSPSSINHCTNPAPVDELSCNPVAKQPELILNWSFPNGKYEGFNIKALNNKPPEMLGKENKTSIKNLDYFTNYTITVITRSCEKESSPKEIRCRTSITDPPPPSQPPNVVARSHSSLKVQFDNFNSSNGPVTAYAIIVTTADVASPESLQYTYDDFIQKKTNSYVASVITAKQKRSSSFHSSQPFDSNIGDGSKVYGYVNGKLEPLGSYRACVAGFTQIAFLNKTVELISKEESYVSFSPVSDSVTLPQNPDVIIGAVVGCLLAAIVIAAAVGFIFWQKRRHGGKNNEVPFSPIEPKKSKLIKVENFESYFKKQKADSNCGFAEEYEDLRPVGVNQPKFAAEVPDNKGKNRYNNVLPYDISRVKLSTQSHPGSDYINANYMPGYNSKKEFIAAQGPLPTTVQDFWRMIWEKDIYTVVMLTKCVEQGRTKCEEYWPNKQSKSYGDITVAMTSEIVLPEWTIRDFSMEKSDSSESHPVRQFHFTAWPDHGVPETTDLLISFRHLVQEYMKQNPLTSPTLVHCSAGVGRTGTFIAIDRLIHQMEMENTVDVYGVVYDLRMHRSLMVQTEDQYVFLNQCVLDIIKSKKETKTDLIYQNTNAMAIYENFTPSPHTGKANGYHI
nr:receptor-type tyrosine-protein phosphatase eta [Anolis sagrei ordinatus]